MEYLSHYKINPFTKSTSFDIACILTVNDSIDISCPITSIECCYCIRKSFTLSVRKDTIFSHIIGHIDEHITDDRRILVPVFSTDCPHLLISRYIPHYKEIITIRVRDSSLSVHYFFDSGCTVSLFFKIISHIFSIRSKRVFRL